MQQLEVSCAVRRFFKSLGFKGLTIIDVNPCLKIQNCFHDLKNKSPPQSNTIEYSYLVLRVDIIQHDI